MRKNREIKLIFVIVAVFFLAFLCVPMVRILMKSFAVDGGEGFTLSNYVNVLTERGFLQATANSLLVSSCSALITTVLAFVLAYTIHYTDTGEHYKSLISKAAVLPMLLPTITYGFAIIYSFGKEGLLTRLFGRQLFDIYGFQRAAAGVCDLHASCFIYADQQYYGVYRQEVYGRLTAYGRHAIQDLPDDRTPAPSRDSGGVFYPDIFPLLYGLRYSGVGGREF